VSDEQEWSGEAYDPGQQLSREDAERFGLIDENIHIPEPFDEVGRTWRPESDTETEEEAEQEEDEGSEDEGDDEGDGGLVSIDGRSGRQIPFEEAQRRGLTEGLYIPGVQEPEEGTELSNEYEDEASYESEDERSEAEGEDSDSESEGSY
jgi:hypothetical protein